MSESKSINYADPALRKKIRKVLLISPPGKITPTAEGSQEDKLAVPPLGLAYLAAYLRINGIETEILDIMMEGYEFESIDPVTGAIYYGLKDEAIIKRIEASKADLIGLSCLFSNRGDKVLHLCKLAKQTRPDAHVVLGGQHPSGMPELIKDGNIDYIISGEGESSLLSLIQAINAGEDLRRVPQIVLPAGNEWWKSDVKALPDVKKLPWPAWDLVPMKKYWDASMPIFGGHNNYANRFMAMITSRGCPHSCYFCTSTLMANRNYRAREITDVLEEIKTNVERYGVEEVFFWDDNFFINGRRVKKLLRMIIDAFPDMIIQVPSGAEINALDDEILDLLAEANFPRINLPIESANIRIQEEKIDKKVNVNRVKSVVNRLRQAGIVVTGSFMVGFPGETKAEMDHTFDVATQLDLDVISIAIVNPLPGTQLYDECVSKGLLYDDFNVNDLRWSRESIRLEGIERGYLAERRRQVWCDYMSSRINIEDKTNGNTSIAPENYKRAADAASM